MPLAELHSQATAHRGSAGSRAARLSIALVSTQRGFRGGEMQLRLLAHGFRAAGERPLIYARRAGPLAERLAAEGFEVFAFGGSGYSPLALWQIRQRLKRDRPDVLYFNDSHALSSAGLASCGLGIGLRVAARRVAFAIRSSWKYRHFCDVVLANCNATVDVCAAGGIPRDRIHVVHDGVPPLAAPAIARAESRRRLGLGDSDLVALTVAALTAEKGHAVLLDALPGVVAEHPNLQWLCAGGGPLRPALEEQAARLGFTGRVHFLGQRSDIADLMAAADLFVLPSLCEGLCNAAIEAQYARVPLAATNTGGLADVVGSNDAAGPTAWMADPGNAAQLTAAMNRALADAAESRRLAERGHERATRMFTVERMIEETLAKFRTLLAQRR
jgi:glycosyltransferase involved in cell wall biosynthesis